ncbi:hypothetical protein ACMFMF_006097 [Clarireedia jacksonii]
MSKPRIYLTRMTVEDHFDDFWEIWKDERALGWSTHAPKVIREDAVALMTKLLPAEQGGEEGGIDKFAVMLREEGGEGSEGGKGLCGFLFILGIVWCEVDGEGSAMMK